MLNINNPPLICHRYWTVKMNIQTLLQIFNAGNDSCLIGTEAVRDGINVPGQALRIVICDGVPWPRSDILFKTLAEWIIKNELTDRIMRMKLRQAYGRLIRKSDDKGLFVTFDSALPSRLSSAFPSEVSIQRISLANAMFEIHNFSVSEYY